MLVKQSMLLLMLLASSALAGLPEGVENLIPNGSFEVDQTFTGDGWANWANPVAPNSSVMVDFTQSIDGTGSCRIDPDPTGNLWNYFVIIRPITMEVGETYTYSYWAKAAEPRRINTAIKGTNDQGYFAGLNADLTTEWAEFTATGVLDASTEGVCKMDIACGGPGTVWVDFMHLYKGPYIDVTPSGDETPPGEVNNLITNGNFETDQNFTGNGWGNWANPAAPNSSVMVDFSQSIDGSGSCRIDADPTGTLWQYFVIVRPLALEIDETYSYSYWAKASEPRQINTLIKGTNNSGAFGVINADLTTEWAQFSATGVCDSATEGTCKMDIACGGPGTVWVDFMHLYKGEYVEFVPGGRDMVTTATNPIPLDGEVDVAQNVVLTWTPSETMASQNIYLGTSLDDVNNADVNSPLLLHENIAVNTISPELDFVTEYFWRVDSIDADNVTTKGDVWSFTSGDFVLVDDMESYTDDWGNIIFQTWIDGWGWEDPEGNTVEGNGSGATVGYWPPPAVETSIVFSGQSMPFEILNSAEKPVAEATRTFAPWDWTDNDVKTLSLAVHGQPFNKGDQLYIKINDVKIPLADSINKEYWVTMYVDLATVQTDLTQVTSLTIGVEGTDAWGKIFVDDIRLLRNVIEVPSAGTDKPAIDGEIDAVWANSPAHAIDFLRDGVELENELDCSGTLQMLWDADHLYILVDIIDEALVQDSDQGWHDDRIEAFIDADGSRTKGGPGSNGNDGVNDYQYCFSWTPTQVADLEWYYRNDETKNSMAGVVSGVAITDLGYRIEVKFPWATLKGSAASAGDFMGIGLAVDDDDDGGNRDSQVSGLIGGVGNPHIVPLWEIVKLVDSIK